MEQLSGGHAAYTVGGKKFAYLLEDHHWDGRLACASRRRRERDVSRRNRCAFTAPRTSELEDGSAPISTPPAIDWEELAGLVVESYVRVAPTRLVRLIARAHSDARL